VTAVTSAQCAVIDALVALATTNLTGVAVVDGPDAGNANVASSAKRLYVGCDDATNGAESHAADSVQTSRTIGMQNRREDITVYLVAEGTDPNGVMKTARDGANATLRALELLLRPTGSGSTLETISGTVMWGEVADTGLMQKQTAQGAYARIDITVKAVANLSR
jgi:hypothetical protein